VVKQPIAYEFDVLIMFQIAIHGDSIRR